jgi:hypothetical protein
MKLLKLLMICIFGLFTVGCNTDDIDDIDNNGNYYVKYHYIISTRYDVYDKHSGQYCSAKIKYIDSNYKTRIVEYQNSYRYEYDVICGPFKYNDVVELTIYDKFNVGGFLCEIYVSKNNEPFTLRYYGTNNTNKYVINYN